ncbi:asparagine synthase (glutamine-hydrolyzing) [Candidatus Poribacteria bacterium]|nr:asparagine synthase (glutamine-hydrolyzing) [Candidatus Poribacteria bacterium]
MCGISGFININNNLKNDELSTIIKKMNNALHHRGPDDSGVWVDNVSGVALGHRRLSIIDLSSEGHQPMFSNSGRYVIIFNGEIYNFNLIKSELEKSNLTTKWRGHSDTEIILASIEAWGLENSLKRFIGMFAIALWDRKEQTLYLSRDRLGEKPLYYGWMGNTFMFASELKALKFHPGFKSEINRDNLALYLRHNYIPTPYSIYNNINKLVPGTFLKIKKSDNSSTKMIPIPYWSSKQVVNDGIVNIFGGTESEAIEHLDTLLRDAVRQQMMADVPLGAFLSGGVDSSTIVALMQVQSNRPVKTFTIGFHENTYNEAEYAKAVAKHLKTEHTELYVTAKQAMDVIPKLPAIYDEPFSDSSQIPTFLVSQLTRQYVTVSLSGDGGDELFCGYKRYFAAKNLWNLIKLIPFPLRKTLSRALYAIPINVLNNMFGWTAPILNKYGRPGQAGDKLNKLAEILSVYSARDIYIKLTSHWKDPNSLVIGSVESSTILSDNSQWENIPDFLQWMMYIDMVTYLPDDILVKVDRAAMNVSLETRVPLLDHRVVEFAWQLPLSMKIKNKQNKWLLKQILYKYVPKNLIERPKMGFGVPIDIWLRGPLRDWAESLINEKRLIEEGFFDPEPIQKKWKEHISGIQNWHYYLWDVLMFQAWLDENKQPLN